MLDKIYEDNWGYDKDTNKPARHQEVYEVYCDNKECKNELQVFFEESTVEQCIEDEGWIRKTFDNGKVHEFCSKECLEKYLEQNRS